MIEAVIFDMDGVLADTEYYYENRRKNFLLENGIESVPPPQAVRLSARAPVSRAASNLFFIVLLPFSSSHFRVQHCAFACSVLFMCLL